MRSPITVLIRAIALFDRIGITERIVIPFNFRRLISGASRGKKRNRCIDLL